jgi:DNA-binding transcriptional regulator LsrR (DeoR family)
MAKPQSVSRDVLLLRTAELFFGGKTATEIRDVINHEYSPVPRLTRESVYPLLVKAKSRGFIQFVPPIERSLSDQVIKQFDCAPDSVVVVNTTGKESTELVAAAGAELALKLIKQIWRRKGTPVGVGLGPGRATLDFSVRLSRLLEEPDAPKLNLFAISAGCPSHSPEYASTSFFNLFPRSVTDMRVGLFAQTLVRNREFKSITKVAGVSEVFQKRDQIDLVVTSMGDASDEHDLLSMFLQEAGLNIDTLRKEGWVGNVQYRPYSLKAPIEEGPDMLRAVTVFELHELRNLARQKGKHVVLIARQCGICGRTRAAALRPLLTVPELRVFSELVMDVATAKDLLRQGSPTTADAVGTPTK